MTMDDDYCTDPDCDDQCPDEVHFHLEIRIPEPEDGGHAVIEDRRAYFWPGPADPILPRGHEGDDLAAAGWKEIGWVDEIHDFEDRITKIEALKTQASFYYATTAQDISAEALALLIGEPPKPRPNYPLIDIDQVKWTATPRNPKGKRIIGYIQDVLGTDLVLDNWQRKILEGFTVDYQQLLQQNRIGYLDNQIRAVTPPGMIGTVYAEINRLATETEAGQEFAREIVYNRMLVTGNPGSIISGPPTLYNLQLELGMLRRHQRGEP